MDGIHGRSTLEDDLGQQLLGRAAHGKLARWGASWEQNTNDGNDSSNWEETQQQRVSPLFENL